MKKVMSFSSIIVASLGGECGVRALVLCTYKSTYSLGINIAAQCWIFSNPLISLSIYDVILTSNRCMSWDQIKATYEVFLPLNKLNLLILQCNRPNILQTILGDESIMLTLRYIGWHTCTKISVKLLVGYFFAINGSNTWYPWTLNRTESLLL